MPKVKYCSGCKRLLEVITGTSFNKKDGTLDGLQPWCRECDYRQKGLTSRGWVNFQRMLKSRRERGEPQYPWTESEYLKIMCESGDFNCKYCGAWCPRWGSGYWIDRVDNDILYQPDNCVPCCWPCNAEKKNKNPESFHAYIKSLLERYGRGKVPWGKVGMFKETKAPDLSRYVVADPQLSLLSLDGGHP